MADQSMTLESASLQYLNSNLLSHGFAKSPINLQGLSVEQEKNVVAVMSSLLQQRMDDIKTTEHLSAALNKQQYDVTRLTAQISRVSASHAKLETESLAFKAREAERVRQAQEIAESNKVLRDENARARNALMSVKVNAQHEAKKTQIKLDKAVAQLQKLSSDASLISSPCGIVHLNAIAPGQDTADTPKMGTLLEMSLRDLADIRESLQEETEAFRHVVLGVGNSLRELVALSYGQEAPSRLLHSQFFTLTSGSTNWQSARSSAFSSQVASSTSHPTLAAERLRELVAQLRNRILDPTPIPQAEGSTAPISTLSLAEIEAERRRIEEMKRRIGELEMDLVEAGKREEEGRKLMRDFASNLPIATESDGVEEGIDVVGKRLAEAAELEAVRRQREALERERRRVVQETTLLSRERDELEAARRAASERQRALQLETILDDLPSTPDAPLATSLLPEGTSDFPTFSMSPNLKALLEPAPAKDVRAAPPSPHTPKTKQHAVGRRRKGPAGPGTPLARMVMAKAVARAGGTGVLGVESGRKTNVRAPARSSSGSGSGSNTLGISKAGSADGVRPRESKKSSWR